MKDILDKTPEYLPNDPFWTKEEITKRSKFGAEPRKLYGIKKDDPYRLLKDIDDWKYIDEYTTQHGRLKIADIWGKYEKPPTAGYSPDHSKLTKSENTPLISISNHYRDTEYYKQLQDNGDHSVISFGTAKYKEMKSKGLKPSTTSRSKNSATKSSGEFKNINIEDMRKSLLPGPGSYEVQVKEQLKFDKTPMPLLRPKTNRGKSRQKLDFENLEIIKDPNALFDGSYFPEKDPTMKTIPQITIGERRKLLNQREYTDPGPGDYNPSSTFNMGNSAILSSSTSLKLKAIPGFKLKLGEGRQASTFGRKRIIN